MKCIAIILLCAAPAFANAEIYKWTDAKGRVQFSDKPVGNSSKSDKPETVKIKDYKPGTDENVRQIYERNDRLRAAATAKTPEQQRVEAQKIKQQKADCVEAAERLTKISGRVIFHDDDGKFVPTTETQRAAKEQELRAWIKEHCP